MFDRYFEGAIEELERAINNPGLPSKCVTIPRSLDGRLQVSHRKGLPHVIYCRIFRWPDLQTPHELRAVDCCEFPFSSKQNEVCVNPYHYERVDIPVMPPVLVPKHVEFSMGHSLLYNPSSQTQNYANSLYYSQHSQLYTNTTNVTQYYQHQQQTSVYGPRTMSPGVCYSPEISQKDRDSCLANQYLGQLTYHSASPSTTCSANEYPKVNISHNNASRSNSSSSSFVGSPEAGNEELDNTNSSSPHRKQPVVKASTQAAMETENSGKPANWCSIVYYELNQRIGEIFHAASDDIFVDGFTDPRTNWGRKFSLGTFSNVNRNLAIENCRKHIGRGKNHLHSRVFSQASRVKIFNF